MNENKPRNLLVIPDIHNRHQYAESVIAKFPGHHVLFLGDYFDNFGDNPNVAENTAKWLKKSLCNPNRTHLWGNHDLSYYAPIQYGCSGYDELKERAISRVMKERDWAKLKFFHHENGFLFTHAGYSNPLAGTYGLDFPKLETKLQESIRQSPRRIHPLLDAGTIVGGPAVFGGIVWARIYQDYVPIPGIRQIFGHTPGPSIREDDGNYCIDCLAYGTVVTVSADGEMKPQHLKS